MARLRRPSVIALGALAGIAAPFLLRSSPAAPLDAGLLAAGKPIGGGATPEGDTETGTRRRLEIEDLERQDAARELERRGVRVRWQEVSLREMLDWCDRIDAARALSQVGVGIDWRRHTLAELWDFRLRVAKAAELRTHFGVEVDWRRYRWSELEELRRTLARLRGRRPEDALAKWGASGEAGSAGGIAAGALDPDSLIRPTFAGRSARRVSLRRDPDDVLAPSFAFRYPPVVNAGRDPDGLLRPQFRPAPGRARDLRGAGKAADPDAVLDLPPRLR